MRRLRHGRVELALHELAERAGTPLLLLHALAASSRMWDVATLGWPGPVYALDFAGHGASGVVRGGAYGPELLAGDVDTALAVLGRAALAGAGLGAYVALLLAGARPRLVPATLLLPGAGLAGGGPWPGGEAAERLTVLPDEPAPAAERGDARVRLLERDIRPRDYADAFARAARRVLLLEDGGPRPPWWAAVRECPSVETVSTDDAFARLATAAAG